MSHVSIYVTCPDAETARRIARELLERRLVACANMLPTESLYQWEGRIEEAQETVMFLKTRREKAQEVIDAVVQLHPYDVPCAVAFDLVAGNADYLGWIDKETGKSV